MVHLRKHLFFIALIFFLTGCGYSLTGRTSPLIQGRSLYLPMFANRTYQPNIEALFRKSLLNELAMRGENIVPENEADLIFSGELGSGSVTTKAYSAADKAMIYSINLTVMIQLAERQSGRIIWKTSETLRQEYPASAELGLQRNNRDAAINSLCNRMATIVVQKMAQTF